MAAPKPRDHKLADRHPFLCVIPLSIIVSLLISPLSQLLDRPLELLFPAYPQENGPVGVLQRLYRRFRPRHPFGHRRPSHRPDPVRADVRRRPLVSRP